MRKFKTHEQYIEDLQKLNPTIIPLEKYVSAKTPILHKCLTHNVEWKSMPTNILKGCGCKKCLSEKIKKKLTKTHEEYVMELRNVNDKIEVLDQYKNSLTPILHKCMVCNYEWNVTPADLLSGNGCPKCANNIKLTPDEYKQKVKKINPNIIVLDNYINTYSKIRHKCLVHNYIWETSPASIKMGCGCPLCGIDKVSKSKRKTHEQYVEELKEKNPSIVCMEKYKSALKPFLHKCLQCGFKWNVAPCNILSGHGCPRCKASNGEKEIEKWLIENNIEYISQKRFKNCRDIKPLPFDFYLPKLNKCIEYDGEQHFKPIDYFGGEEMFKVLQLHDKIKKNYCIYNNIPLLRIPYYEENIKTQLDNFIFN